MTIIGIVGQPGSGKDTAADYFVTKGFQKISLGDVLREKMRELGIPTDRQNVHEFVKKQRELRGNSYPVGDAVKNITSDTVVVGFRNTEEVKEVKKHFGKNFILVAVEALPEIRYKWIKERNRVGDDISFEQFMAEENQERAAESGSHEVDAVIKMADFMIANDGSKEEFFRRLERALPI